MIALPFSTLLINKIWSIYYDRTYINIEKGASSDHYSIRKIEVPGYTFKFHFSSERAVLADKTGKSEQADASGYLYFDTLKKHIILETEEYIPANTQGDGGDMLTHYLRIDLDGKIIEDVKGFYIAGTELLKNSVLLNNELLPFQKWSDPSQAVYMKHFSKNKFNSTCLNPLRGIGNPTGSSPCNYWDGFGYYDIRFNEEVLKVKIPCGSSALFFSEDHEYATGLDYYQLPDSFRDEFNIAFLVYANNYDKHTLAIIQQKSN